MVADMIRFVESPLRIKGDSARSSTPHFTLPCFRSNPFMKISFTLDQSVKGPLYLYYQLSNYYQNHNKYQASYETLQLSGQDNDCPYLISVGASETRNGSLIRNPCGLIAASYFNGISP